jgi:hypothetical protein
MAETRDCEQCGVGFTPRREHARFCSARCRVAWNREHTGDRAAEESALGWSMTAMRDATGRLLRAAPRDRARPFAVISEAVWWVTIVDATLVRYHPDTYDIVLASRPGKERRLIEETLGGLRFVRNRMGQYLDPVDFIQPDETESGSRPGSGSGDAQLTAWTWKSVPRPALDSLPLRGQEWEMTRYRAYEAQLAGHTIGETFGRAVDFLKLAAEQAVPAAEAGARDADGAAVS